jgi:hypothetical protein
VPHPAAWTPKKKVRERTRTTRARVLIVAGREKGNKKRKKKSKQRSSYFFLLEYYHSQIKVTMVVGGVKKNAIAKSLSLLSLLSKVQYPKNSTAGLV